MQSISSDYKIETKDVHKWNLTYVPHKRDD